MSGFTIGRVVTGDKKGSDHTEVSLVDGGIRLWHCAWFAMSGGGLGTYTPAQARELGQLLINAADRWTELNAQVRQAEAEIEAVNRTVRQRIKDALA